MTNFIVLYRSKTGFSRRYAQWLGEALRCEALDCRRAGDLGAYGGVILVGGLYAGRMAGLGWLKKQRLEAKRTAAVAVGCAPMDNPGLEESMEKLFGPLPQIRGFYCQGGLDYERMGRVDRAMMAALRASLRKNPERAEMLEVISRSFDASSRAYLDPVIAWAEEG